MDRDLCRNPVHAYVRQCINQFTKGGSGGSPRSGGAGRRPEAVPESSEWQRGEYEEANGIADQVLQTLDEALGYEE